MTLIDPSGLIWGYQDFDKDGHHYRKFVWFEGNKVGKNFHVFTPERGGTVINLIDGTAARLWRNTNRVDILPRVPGIAINGQDRVNAAAGMFDGTVPGGKKFREWALEGPGGVDTKSSEYQNASAIGNGTVQGALLFMGGPEAKASEEAIGLTKQLASESQVAELLAGQGKAIIGAGTDKVLVEGSRLAAEYGGQASDWAKVTSSAFQAADKAIIETHAYKNLIIGKLEELKSVSSSFPGRP